VTTDIEAISASEAAIAVDPIHAKRVPYTKDVWERYKSDDCLFLGLVWSSPYWASIQQSGLEGDGNRFPR
jgi:hypothetical protein